MKGFQDSKRHFNGRKLDKVRIGLFIFIKTLKDKVIFGIIRIK